MKTLALTLICSVFFSLSLFAQKDKKDKEDLTYAQKAADIQAKIWGDRSPEFDVKTIPASMQKESAVIIAQSTNIQQTTGSRLKFAFYIPTSATRTSKVTTFRERVKINDKVALEAYSTLSYQKSLDKTQRILYFKVLNKKDTYVGVKIIKPNGKEVVVNTGEEVLTKNESKDKEGKLAIPGLEVGDILDYYISNVDLVEGGDKDTGNSSYLYVLTSEYPILNYQLSFQFNKKLNIYFVNANGAPEFTETTVENDDKLYTLNAKNLAKFSSDLWSVPQRQCPYIELVATYKNSYLNFLSGQKDTYNKNKSRIDNYIKDYETFLNDDKVLKTEILMANLKDAVERYYLNGKAYKAAPLADKMRVFYDYWKFNAFCEYFASDLKMTVERNKRHAFSRLGVYAMARYLIQMDVDFDIFILASRNSGSLENIMDADELQMMIRINGGDKPMYMACNDRFTQFNEIPKEYQGEEAIVLSHKKNNLGKFEQSSETIPVTPSTQNYFHTTMNIAFVADNMSKIKIERTVSDGGSMRHNEQPDLMLPEFYDEALRAILAVNVTEPSKRIYGSNDLKKSAVELKSEFELAKKTEEANFKGEIKGEFGEDPLELSNYRITAAGISSIHSEFTFTGSFVMDNFVKNAGGNYIFEVGKLIGDFNTKVEDKDLARTADVYMPAARNLTHDITFAIPKGYQVKGVEDLNHQEKNAAGEFTVTAKTDGTNLIIKVTRVYNHNFEKAAQWPQLVAILNAAYNFSTQKVLFEKM